MRPAHEWLNREYFRMFRQLPWMLRLRLDGRHGAIPRDVGSILVVNNALIGEFVASLPALRHLLDSTHAAVDLVVAPPVVPLARRLRGVRAAWAAPSVYRRATEASGEDGAPPTGDYDLVVVVQLSWTTYEWLRRLRYRHIKAPVATYLGYLPSLLRHLDRKTGLRQHEDLVFEILEQTRRRRVTLDDVIQFSAEDHAPLADLDLGRDATRRRVVVHTGSGWAVKLWRNERWIEVLRRIGALGDFEFLFVGGSEREERDVQEIRRHLAGETCSLVRRVNLAELALIMRSSDYFLGIDSGPRHIAHLLDLPSVCLLGPGPKMFSPPDRKAVLIDRSSCRCTSLFCYRRTSCMDRIQADEVVEAFAGLLKTSSGTGQRAAGAGPSNLAPQ